MNRRGFLRQTAKAAVGLVAANAVPISAKEIIPVAEPSRVNAMIFEVRNEAWKDISFKVHDLTGYAKISREMLEDCAVPFERLIESMSIYGNAYRRTS